MAISQAQSSTVLELLRHLHDNGFTWAPKPFGTGFTSDGRERLSFIEGTSPQPSPWTDDAIHQVGHLLRRLHDVATTFEPAEPPAWVPWFARSLPGVRSVIGHGDLGPWNILAREGIPIAFIDWDTAGPVDADWELAQVGWLNAHLHDDDVAKRSGLASAEDRALQLVALVAGYELERDRRLGLVDHMVEFAIRAARDEAVLYEVGPNTASPADDGFPIAWAISWRARAAGWMLDHRAILERALTTR